MVTLVLGAARSGKSRYAEGLITARPAPWRYVATAEAGDDEMAARIAAHRARRGGGWTVVETPRNLAAALGAGDAIPTMVDCLTLWLSSVMMVDADIEAEIARLEDAVRAWRGHLVLVTNEVGASIVPDSKLARRFRDAQGVLNQRMAACADRVVLVVAGLPLFLKGQP